MANFIITGNGTINLALNNRQYAIGTDHVNYGAIRKNLENDKILETLVDIPKSVHIATNGNVVVEGDVVKYKGEVMHNALTCRIIGLIREGLPFKGFVNLLERIMKNPSNRSRQEGYNFLDKEGIPITPEGMILGYKVVQGDYWSKTGGTLKLLKGKVRADGRIYNAPGEEIECERGDVDDDANNTCSHGLHVGGVGYATPGGTFYSEGDKVVIIEFDPADIVSVPNDYNATKIRVCKYKVVAEYAETFDKVQYEVKDGNITPSQVSERDWVGGQWYDEYEDDQEDEYEDDDYYDYYEDEDDEDESSYNENVSEFGRKPDGSRFWNVRDSRGHFRKK